MPLREFPTTSYRQHDRRSNGRGLQPRVTPVTLHGVVSPDLGIQPRRHSGHSTRGCIARNGGTHLLLLLLLSLLGCAISYDLLLAARPQIEWSGDITPCKVTPVILLEVVSGYNPE